MTDTYPHDLLFPGREFLGVIRVSTAASLLALEVAIEGFPHSDSENARLVELRVHAFCAVPLSGNLLRRSEVFRKALCDSIQRSELKPVSVRRSLDGAPDPQRTWILVDDLHHWCEEREMHLGDLIGEYREDEADIFLAANEAAEGARRQLEDPEQETRIQERARKLAESTTVENIDLALALVRENERLLAIVQSKNGNDEKPLEDRARTTFLNMVGALLKCIGGKEAAIIGSILLAHPDTPGLSERTLQKIFAEAKRSLASS